MNCLNYWSLQRSFGSYEDIGFGPLDLIEYFFCFVGNEWNLEFDQRNQIMKCSRRIACCCKSSTFSLISYIYGFAHFEFHPTCPDLPWHCDRSSWFWLTGAYSPVLLQLFRQENEKLFLQTYWCSVGTCVRTKKSFSSEISFLLFLSFILKRLVSSNFVQEVRGTVFVDVLCLLFIKEMKYSSLTTEAVNFIVMCSSCWNFICRISCFLHLFSPTNFHDISCRVLENWSRIVFLHRNWLTSSCSFANIGHWSVIIELERNTSWLW